MEISGSRLISAAPAAIRAALSDPETLKACIPGCERLETRSDDRVEGAVAAKIGPIRVLLEGGATASDRTPEGWRLEAEGADASAGSGRGNGSVTLAEAEGGTLLSYQGSIELDGKVGQLGSRLLTGVARQSIDAFLANLAARIGGAAAPAAEAEAPVAAPAEPPAMEAPPLVHEEPDPAPELKAPPLAGAPLEPAPIAPTAVPDVPDPVAIAAADAVSPKEGGSVGRIMLVAAIVVAVGVAIYFGFLQRPPA